MPNRDIVSLTKLISAHVSEDNSFGAFRLFGKMQNEVEPNAVTMLGLPQGCPCMVEGRQLHGYIIKNGFLIDCSVSLLKMYIYIDSVSDAEVRFGEINKRDVITWNIMLSLYSSKGDITRMIGSF